MSNRKTRKGMLYLDFDDCLKTISSEKLRLKLEDMFRLTKYTPDEVFKALLAAQKSVFASSRDKDQEEQEDHQFLYAFMGLLDLENTDILEALKEFIFHARISGESHEVEAGIKLFSFFYYKANQTE